MSSITLPVTFTDTDLDSTTDLKTQVLALASLSQWLQVDPAYGTLSAGRLASLTDLKSGVIWTASSAGNGPLVAANAAYPGISGGYPVAAFEDSVDRSIVAPANPDLTGSWSIVMLHRRGTPPASGPAVLFSQSGTGNETSIAQSTNAASMQAFHKGSGINIAVGGNAPDTAPKLIIVSYNGTLLRGSVGNGAVASTTPAGALGSGLTTRVGRHFASDFGRGDWSDLLIFPTLSLHDTANSTTLQLVKDLFSQTYGLTL